MREGLLFPGVILLVLMILFAFVPLPYPASGSVTEVPRGASGGGGLVIGPPSFPYSQTTPISIQWSGGNAQTWVQLLPCAPSGCGAIKAQTVENGTVTPLPFTGWDAMGYGSGGTFTVWVPTNQSMMLETNYPGQLSITVTWNEMPEFSLFWQILTIIGVLLGAAGAILPEAGAPRGHQRRLHYGHWRHHAFALPPHLPSEGLACPACGLTDIPHEDDYCPRCHAPLPRTSSTMAGAPAAAVAPGPPASYAPAPGEVSPGPPAVAAATPEAYAAASAPATPAGSESALGEVAGMAAAGAAAEAAAPPKKRTAVNRSKIVGQSLSVADADPMKPWRVVKGLGFNPPEVLVFTREDPQILQERYHLEPELIYTVTRSEGERAISPGEGDKIADLAEQHLRTHRGSVVVLTDPNYIVTHVGFESLQRLSHALQDHARDQRGTFILAFNPQVLSPEQRAHLEERMRKVL